MSRPPVLLFVYRRMPLLPRVMDALEACAGFRDSEVIVYSDGPRTADAKAEVQAVRDYVRSRLRPNMRLVERPENLGLAASIIAGVTEACNRTGSAIVIEDDLVLAPLALDWFQAGIERYKDEPRVMQVSGFAFDVPAIRKSGRAIFFNHPTSWGWAVWHRSWQKFEPACVGWEDQLRDNGFRKRFSVGRTQRFEQMLRDQMAGKIDSWAVRWHYSVVRNEGLVLYPPQTFVDNVGRETDNATHGQRTAHLMPFGAPWSQPVLPALPSHVAPDDKAVNHYIRSMRYSLFGLATFAASAFSRLRKAVSA